MFDILTTNKDGKWFVFGMKLTECITNEEMKTDLFTRVNVVRLEKGWELI